MLFGFRGTTPPRAIVEKVRFLFPELFFLFFFIFSFGKVCKVFIFVFVFLGAFLGAFAAIGGCCVMQGDGFAGISIVRLFTVFG